MLFIIVIKLCFYFITVKSWNIQNPFAECNTKINCGMKIGCLKEFVERFGGNWHSKYSQQKLQSPKHLHENYSTDKTGSIK